MEKLDNFKGYLNDLKHNEKYSEKNKLNILIKEINENFENMSNAFVTDISIELKKSMKNAEAANKILNCLYNLNYDKKNIENTEMGEFSIVNGVIEEAVDKLLETYKGETDKDLKKRKEILLGCYSKIAGKEGTTNTVISKLSMSDIDLIIRGKIDKDGINNDELINIIYKKAPTIIDDDENKEFINLIEDAFIADIKKNPTKLKNPNAFKIFEILVKEYKKDDSKNNSDIYNVSDKVKEILEMADKLTDNIKEEYGENRSEYIHACEENFLLKKQAYGFKNLSVLEIKKLFGVINLKDKIDTAEQHISEGAIESKIERGDGTGKSNTSKVMSNQEKLVKIFDAVEKMQEKYPDKGINIGEIYEESNNKSFDKFYIFQMRGIHCYLLEKFNDQENTALYIVDSKDINTVFDIIREQRQIVKSHPLVQSVNHTESDEKDTKKSYVSRIVEKMENTMQQDILVEMWDQIFEIEQERDKYSETDGREGIVQNLEGQHVEYDILTRLNAEYDKKWTEIEKQEKIVDGIKEARFQKAEKYAEKINKTHGEK